MKRLLFVFTCITLFFYQAKAFEDTTYTISDSGQVQVADSVETDPGLMMDSIFRKLDAQYMSTNLLADRSITFIDYRSYHGRLADSNYMNYGKFLQLNAAMLTAIHDTGHQVKRLDTIKHWYDYYDSLGYQSFGLLNLQYNQLKKDALSNNLIQKNGVQLEDVAGRSENPYLTEKLFAGGFQEKHIKGPYYNFLLPSELFISNTGEALDSLLVDFDDGNGFQQISLDSSHTVYTPTGVDTATIVVKAVFQNDSSFQTHTKVITENYARAQYETVADFDTTFNAVNHQNDEPHDGGTVQVAYGCGSEDITRPLIVVEGFNPEQWGNMRYFDFLDDLEDGALNLHNNLELNAYDIIYVDYNNSLDHIQHNAELVEDVIQWVNQRKAANGSDYENVVLGRSMGGLVARWALNEMENDANQSHDTRLYVSHDAPHRGANVPVAVQSFVRHLETVNIATGGFNFNATEIFPELDQSIQVLNSVAARQMSIYYNPSPFTKNVNSNDFRQFLNNYENVTLDNCREVAVSNGSALGDNGGQDFNPYDRFLTIESPDASLVNSRFVLRTLPNDGNTPDNIVYSGEIHIQVDLGIWKPTVTITDRNVRVSGNIQPYGSSPGGIYDVEQMGGFDPDNMIDQMPDWLAGNSTINNRTFSFVPTISALDIEQEDPNFDVQANLTSGMYSFTNHFARTQTQNANEQHPAFTGENEDFFMEEILGFDPQLSEDVINNFTYTNGVTQYNMGINSGNNDVTTANIGDLILHDDEVLYINHNTTLGTATSGRSNPTPNSTFTARTTGNNCNGNADVLISDGELNLGNPDEPNNAAVLRVDNGSTLELGSFGKLEVNDNSRVVIDENSSLVVNEGSEITLNGDNAELVIKGQLIIEDDATFTFSGGPAGNGKVIFDSEKEDFIQFGEGSNFKLVGDAFPIGEETDEILVVRQNDLEIINPAFGDGPDEFELKKGNVRLGEDVSINLKFRGQGEIRSIEITGYGNEKHNGLWIRKNLPNFNVHLYDVHIHDGHYGLRIWQGVMGGFRWFRFSISNLEVKNCDVGVNSIGGSLRLKNANLMNNGIGWDATGMSGASKFTDSIFSSADEAIHFRGDYSSSLHVNAAITHNQHGILFYGNTLRTYCSEIVNNVGGDGVRLKSANLQASTELASNAGITDFSGNSTAIKMQSGFSGFQRDLFLNKGYNKLNGDTWTVSGGIWSDDDAGSSTIPVTKNFWGTTNTQPVYNTNYRLDFFYESNNSVFFREPAFPDFSPVISSADFEDKFQAQCEPDDSEVYDPGVVALVLPDETNLPHINTASFPDVRLDHAVESAMTLAEDTAQSNNYFRSIEQFSEILNYNYQEPKDSTTKYLLDLAYDQMTFNFGRGIADSQVVAEAEGEMPDIANTVIATQQYLLNELPEGEEGRQIRFRKFQLSLDKALIYKDFGLRAEAQSQLAAMTTWVENQTNLEVIDYWQCITNYEIELADTSTDVAYMDSLYNCTLPEFTPPEEGEEPVEQPFTNMEPQFEDDNLKLYPNPAQDETLLQTDFDQSKEMTVAVHTIQGQKVMEPYVNFEMKEGKNRLKLNTSSLSAGQYFVKVRHGNEQTVLRFTKVNR